MALWTWIGIFSRFGETAARIIKPLEERVTPVDEPRPLGNASTGDHSGYWR